MWIKEGGKWNRFRRYEDIGLEGLNGECSKMEQSQEFRKNSNNSSGSEI